jgi:hypothetical protein
MDSLYVSVFQDESGSHASRAITSEQLVLLAPPFMRPKSCDELRDVRISIAARALSFSHAQREVRSRERAL